MISLKRATVQENTKPLSIQYLQLPFHRTTVSWRCERSLLAIESSSARRARLNGWRRRHLCWWHQRCNNNGFHMNGKGALFHKCEAACLRQWILIRHYGRKAHKIRQILLRFHIVTMTLMVCFIPVKMNILWNKWNLKLLTSLHLCPTWYWISTINRASHKASIFLVAHGCRQCGDFATNLRCAYFHSREPDFQMSMLDLDRAMSPVHNDLRDSQLSSWHESATSRTRAIGRQYRKYLDTFYYHIWDLISSLARAMQYCRPTSRELQ